MRKYFLIVFILAAMLLAACQAKTPQATETPVASEPATEVALADTPTQAVFSTSTPMALPAANSGPMPGCTVQSPVPTPGPTEQSIFPPVSEGEWVEGPSTAYVTLVEYGDFQ